MSSIDLYPAIINKLSEKGNMKRDDLFDAIAEIDPTINNNRFGRTLQWLIEKGNVRLLVSGEIQLLNDEDKRKTKPEVLANMRGARNVKVEVEGIRQPTSGEPAFQSNPSGERRDVAPFFQKSEGHRFTITREPIEIENVVHATLIFENGQEFNLPNLAKNIRIRNSDGIPAWSPDQSTNGGINAVRFTLLNGDVRQIPLNPRVLTTIAADTDDE